LIADETIGASETSVGTSPSHDGKRAQIADDGAEAHCSLARFPERLQRALQLVHGAAAGADRAQLLVEELQVREHVGERIVHLVRDARCERAHGGEAIGQLQPREQRSPLPVVRDQVRRRAKKADVLLVEGPPLLAMRDQGADRDTRAHERNAHR